MNFDLCASLLQHLDDGRLKIGSAPDGVVAWLATLGLPKPLMSIMQHHWVQADCSFLDQDFDVLSAASIQDDEFTPLSFRPIFSALATRQMEIGWSSTIAPMSAFPDLSATKNAVPMTEMSHASFFNQSRGRLRCSYDALMTASSSPSTTMKLKNSTKRLKTTNKLMHHNSDPADSVINVAGVMCA